MAGGKSRFRKQVALEDGFSTLHVEELSKKYSSPIRLREAKPLADGSVEETLINLSLKDAAGLEEILRLLRKAKA